METDRWVRDVIREISPSDTMCLAYTDAEEHYFSVGESALRAIRLAMLAAGKADADRILDLPCGHGRVLRHLEAAFPRAKLTACDIDREGVDFCARTFGAVPVYSDERPERIRIPGTFDLIWCGSLLTHLPPDKWVGFLELFASLLEPGGVLVFTTHGRLPAEWIRGGLSNYGLSPGGVTEILAGYDQEGLGYASYPGASNYGMSLASPAAACRQLERVTVLQLVLYSEAAWDDHQDVVACVRTKAAPRSANHLVGRHARVIRILREICP